MQLQPMARQEQTWQGEISSLTASNGKDYPLLRIGVRRTTVDEIVKRVNIPKGTFYLFYKSKELLLFEVIQEQQENVNRRLYQTISGIASTELSAKS